MKSLACEYELYGGYSITPNSLICELEPVKFVIHKDSVDKFLSATTIFELAHRLLINSPDLSDFPHNDDEFVKIMIIAEDIYFCKYLQQLKERVA